MVGFLSRNVSISEPIISNHGHHPFHPMHLSMRARDHRDRRSMSRDHRRSRHHPTRHRWSLTRVPRHRPMHKRIGARNIRVAHVRWHHWVSRRRERCIMCARRSLSCIHSWMGRHHCTAWVSRPLSSSCHRSSSSNSSQVSAVIVRTWLSRAP